MASLNWHAMCTAASLFLATIPYKYALYGLGVDDPNRWTPNLAGSLSRQIRKISSEIKRDYTSYVTFQ